MFAFMNVPYGLDQPAVETLTVFRSIWRVAVDESYRSVHPAGLQQPGLFLTLDGTGIVELQPDSSGTGETARERERHRLEPGSCMLLEAGKPCTYYCPRGQTWTFFFIHFSDMAIIRELRLPEHAAIATTQMAYIGRLCEAAISLLIRRPFGYTLAADQLCRELLLLLASEQQQRRSGRNASMEEVFDWIHRHIGDPVDIDVLVKLSKMSRTPFFAAFKSVTGQTPHEYVSALKLESAKLALETTSQSVRAIAKTLGYYDEYHFSKQFKRAVGVAPSVYRQNKRLAAQQ